MTLSVMGDGSMFGRRHGSATPTVLALHGWGRDHADFDAALDGLDALAIDLPGFGASPPPEAGWSSSDYASSLHQIVDEMSRPVVVVGHSFGGRVAVHLATQRRSAVAGLVLTGVPLIRRPSAAKAPLGMRVGRRLHKMGLVGDDRMEALRQRHGSADYRAAEGIMREVLVRAVNETYEPQLREITCPVELVWGDDDTAASPDMARRAEELLTDAQLTIAADIDHFLPVRRPDILRAAIDRRLAEVRR